MTALIVIPAFNESATIGRVVAAARAHAPVLVVDDGSDDASAAVARMAGAEVIVHPRRLGKGDALRSGISAARDRGASVVVTLDADGQHDPDDVPRLLAAARGCRGALVIGDRLGRDDALPPDRLNAVRVAGFFVSWVIGCRLRDTQSGFRAYPLVLLDDVRVRRGGFVFETEVLIGAGARGWAFREIPVTSLPCAARPSRFRPVWDGLAIGRYLAVEVLRRWATEAAAAARAVVLVFGSRARRARHDAVLDACAPYRDSPGSWALAAGVATVHRASAAIGHWWRHPRRRRAAVAAWATLAAPAVLGLVLLQALTGRRLPDVVTPVVSRLYAGERLEDPLGAPAPDGGRRAVVPSGPPR
ncbi:MAG: glycosyltransferase family 2 protein [Candidatus Rokubacteria bacterium]|nr:glycosyltransferase family 2 protein [Candidatus Rokubacteria bacterium]